MLEDEQGNLDTAQTYVHVSEIWSTWQDLIERIGAHWNTTFDSPDPHKHLDIHIKVALQIVTACS